jgi:hypothetical protein
MKKIHLFLALCTAFLISCSGGSTSSSSEVNNICSCIKSSEYFEIIKEIDFDKLADRERAFEYQMKIANKFAKIDYDSKENLEMVKCLAKNVKTILTKYNDLKDNKQKSQFVRNTMTDLLNNECVATVFDKLPFDKIQDQMEREGGEVSLKDIIKLLEKIENAKDFDDIEEEARDLLLSDMRPNRRMDEEDYNFDETADEDYSLDEPYSGVDSTKTFEAY